MKLSFAYSILAHLVLLGVVLFFKTSETARPKTNLRIEIVRSHQSGGSRPLRPAQASKRQQSPPKQNSLDLTDSPDPIGSSRPGSIELDPKYLVQIRNQIRASLEYPLSLRRRGMQGQVTVKLVITEKGDLESSEIIRSSGHEELDQLALEAIESSNPFPSAPEKTMGKLSLSLPIDFKLN